MTVQFQKATKRQAKLRMALIGPAGSGKTMTALKIAAHLGERVALIDTERGSASKYADEFNFDTIALETFAPEIFVETIHAAEEAGYDVLIIDSFSAAWTGKEGALEQVDIATKKSRSRNAFTDGWREVTPQHNRMIDAVVGAKLHVIVTMRTKTEYVLEEDEKGRKVPRKVGLAPVQRSGVEYEFDVTADINTDSDLIIDKTRCRALKGKVFHHAGADVAGILKAWLTDGAPPAEPPAPPKTNGKANGNAPTAVPTPEQQKTHHEIRMMLTTASTDADLDAAKNIIAAKWKAKLLTKALVDDLVEYGSACRAKLSLDAKSSEIPIEENVDDIPF